MNPEQLYRPEALARVIGEIVAQVVDFAQKDKLDDARVVAMIQPGDTVPPLPCVMQLSVTIPPAPVLEDPARRVIGFGDRGIST